MELAKSHYKLVCINIDCISYKCELLLSIRNNNKFNINLERNNNKFNINLEGK